MFSNEAEIEMKEKYAISLIGVRIVNWMTNSSHTDKTMIPAGYNATYLAVTGIIFNPKGYFSLGKEVPAVDFLPYHRFSTSRYAS